MPTSSHKKSKSSVKKRPRKGSQDDNDVAIAGHGISNSNAHDHKTKSSKKQTIEKVIENASESESESDDSEDDEDAQGPSLFSRRPTTQATPTSASNTNVSESKAVAEEITEKDDPKSNEASAIDDADADDVGSESDGEDASDVDDNDDAESEDESVRTTLEELGVSSWLRDSCHYLGIHTPTAVQRHCIPAALSGRNVVGSAPTGSGKTAAFALPILQKLAPDPYGIFAVVLTPTRELAMQIADQFNALGTPINVRCTVIIGGMNMLQQSLELAKMPHIVVGTPGRLADHVMSASPPKLNLVRFLVLDEADRLLNVGFAKDLSRITEPMSSTRRQTLLFSATMSTNVTKLRDLASAENRPAFEYHAKSAESTVDGLREEYLLAPQQVKQSYLTYVMRRMGPVQEPTHNKLISSNVMKRPGNRTGGGQGKGKKKKEVEIELPQYDGEERAKSLIIFVNSCRSCQLVCEMLEILGVPSVSLHAQLDQRRRLASLGKFRSNLVSVLVATDVASRGLDIPSVDLVVNYDVPRLAEDYIHRVGRTARAGRTGRAVTLVSQHDEALVHAVEERTHKQMVELSAVDEDEIVRLLSRSSKAWQAAKLKLVDLGFEDHVALTKKRKRKQNRQARRFAEHSSG